MPRIRRRNVPGFVYHLISRFVDRSWFISSDEERLHYLRLLGSAVKRSNWRCLAFAIMSNHIHLAMVAGNESLQTWARRVHAPFADWMNKRHDRIGPLFVRGPKQFAIAPHRVRDLIAYIHNNPVRAGVAQAVTESTWTSHSAYAGSMAAPPWLDMKEGVVRSGFADRTELVQWMETPGAGTVHARRIEAEMQFGSVPPRETRLDQPAPLAIVHATADHVGITVSQLCSRRKGGLEQFGRAIAVQCAARVGHMGVEIASALRISQQGESVIRRRTPGSPRVADAVTRVLVRLAAQSSASSV